MYTTLADAAVINPVYGAGATKVWYWKGDFARHAMMGLDWLREHNLIPTRNMLAECEHYVLVGTIDLDQPEAVFHAMQGEVWSPKGQANMMIRRLDSHTSMSVGDIADINGVLWFCDTVGFKKLES